MGGGIIYSLLCILLAIYRVYQVAPFIGLADGFTRWEMALSLMKTGKIKYNTVLSPVIPLIQAVIYTFTGSYTAFTILQTTLFYLAIGILLQILLKENSITIRRFELRIWLPSAAAALCIPVVSVFPVLLTDSALCFAGLTALIAIVVYLNQSNSALKKTIVSILMFIDLSFLVALRPNCITVAVGVIFAFIAFFRGRAKFIFIGVTVVSMIMGLNFPKLFIEKTYHAETLGMMWELTRIAKNTGNAELISGMNKYGDTALAVERYRDDFSNDLFWDNNPPYPVWNIADNENAPGVRGLYISTAIQRPAAFFLNKFHFAGNVLGIKNELIGAGRGIHYVDDITKSYGAKDTPTAKTVRDTFINTTNEWSLLTLQPVFLFGITAVLYFLGKRDMRVIVSYGAAFSYYVAFCANTQAHEFRYFAPSFFILLCMVVAFAAELIMRTMNKTNLREAKP